MLELEAGKLSLAWLGPICHRLKPAQKQIIEPTVNGQRAPIFVIFIRWPGEGVNFVIYM